MSHAMHWKRKALILSFALFTGLLFSLPVAAQQKLIWNGTIYTKFLDGNRRVNDALYNNSEFGNGDVGQGTEFEMLFRAPVSRKVEIGGRLKARFDRNFWTNGGGFADDENDPRSAQYVKFRGAYVRLTPGYDWIDSATIGSNDWGQFDGLTQGKIRYIDRDNISGLLFQGSAADRAFRWDIARVSLPKLWAGPEFTTGDLHQMDANWVAQGKYEATDSLNLTFIYSYANDQEIDVADEDNRDGVDLQQRYWNSVIAAKFDWTSEYVDVKGAYYYSQFNTGFNFNGPVRFTPTLSDDDSDSAYIVNIDVNNVGDFTFNFEYFDIGASYFSMMAARRETDVLLTEGREGTWAWSRPDYNYGDNNRGSSRAGIGYGGWDGEAHQVVSINADNDFTDFDESNAESVLGWKGFTFTPRWSNGDYEISAEYTLIDYNSNWQGGARGLGADDNYHPLMDGVRSWGVGGDWRSPFTTYQDKETSIFLIKGNFVFDVGEGLEVFAKYKVVDDQDDRVTQADRLTDAYRVSNVDSINYDDREADYTSIVLSAGYPIFDDLFATVIIERHEVDLFDGTIDVTPPNMEPWEPEFGWIQYMTGQHEKDKLGILLKYFLSGMEFGLNAQFIDGTFDPEFYNGIDGQVVRFNPTTDSVQTAIGEIDVETVDFDHYRLKAFMKVQF